jgi:type III secretion protein T
MEHRISLMVEGYAKIFLDSEFSRYEPTATLTLLFLFFARMFPIISLAPFFGSRVLPNPVKVAFAFCLFAIFLPKLLVVTTTPPQFNLLSLFLFAKELFVGFSIGFIISIPFQIANSAGIIIDHQRGGASLMVNDPTVQNQSSPLGTIFNQVLIILFYMTDAPFLIIELIETSYEIIPPDRFLSPDFFNLSNEFWKMELGIFNKMMVVSIQLATPALLIMLMTDLFLGIANRLAPQVQITFLGMALKSLLGLGIVCIGWNLIVGELGKSIFYWVHEVSNMLQMMKPSVVPPT